MPGMKGDKGDEMKFKFCSVLGEFDLFICIGFVGEKGEKGNSGFAGSPGNTGKAGMKGTLIKLLLCK